MLHLPPDELEGQPILVPSNRFMDIHGGPLVTTCDKKKGDRWSWERICMNCLKMLKAFEGTKMANLSLLK